MANYITTTQQRSDAPDKHVCSSAYVRMDIPALAPKAREAKKLEMKEMALLAAGNLPGNIVTSIVIRDGSVIVEIICSGHLHELLSFDALSSIVESIKEGDVVDGLLTYAAIRTALGVVYKDIGKVAAMLSMYTRFVFDVRKKQVLQMEARPGAIGNLLRFFDAIDSARAEAVSANVRAPAMKRALFHAKTLENITANAEDRALLKRYLAREMRRVKSISAVKETKDITTFNVALAELRNIINRF